jgi:hypothetical protein
VEPEAFITQAVQLGERDGLLELEPVSKVVFAIAEAEAYCDKDGIDALLYRYGLSALPVFAASFSQVGAVAIAAALSELASAGPSDEVLSRANALITSREGYSYESIRAYVAART